MRKVICLFMVLGCMYFQRATCQNNNWGGTVSYGVGELKTADFKTMAHINSVGLSYEIGLKQKYGISFMLRRGTIRTDQIVLETPAFVTDRFAEVAVGGRRYFNISGLSFIYVGVQINGRWMYDRAVESPALNKDFSNIGGTFGAGAFAGIRTELGPKVVLDFGILENSDLAKSFKEREHEFRINQVSLNVGVHIRL
jgi:hypothetical protein